MAVGGSYNAGSARLNIKPDFDGFKAATRAWLKAYNPTLKVRVKPDMSEFRREMATIKKQRAIEVDVHANTKKIKKQFRDQKINVDVDLNLAEARAQMLAFRSEFAEMTIKVRVQIDRDQIRDDIRTAIREAGGVPVGSDSSTTRRIRPAATEPLPGSQEELDRLERRRQAANERRRRANAPTEPIDIDPPSGGGGGGGRGRGTDSWRDRRRGRDGRWLPDGVDPPDIDLPGGGGGGGGGGGIGGASGKLRMVTAAARPALYAIIGIAAVNLVPLIAQLTQAAGALALIPAAAGLAASALGAMVLGSMGISDAFTSGLELATNAGEEAKAQAEAVENAQRNVESAQRGVEQAHRGVAMAARGVRDAEEGVTDAQRAQTRAVEAAERAQEDLTQAREDAVDRIEDLNLALKGSALDEESAILAVERSWERMVNLGRDGDPVSMLDRKEADLSYRQSLQRLDEVRLSNSRLREETAETNAKGVEGAENVQDAQRGVVDANEAVEMANHGVRDSQESLADAQYNSVEAQKDLVEANRNLADAQKDLAEALTEGTAAQKKFDQAMANLSPNAQQFVRTLLGLRDAFVEMRKVVQDNLFEGMSDSVQSLANEWLPILQDELGAVATSINGGLRGVISDLNSDVAQLHWQNIFEETTKSVDDLIGGMSSLAGALTAIGSAGSEFLTDGISTFADTMQRFEDWANSDAGQNSIRGFLRESLDALDRVWEFLKSMGGLIGAIFGTANQTGASMLEQMTSTMDSWTDWLQTPAGQVEMRDFWLEMKDLAEALLQLMGEASKIINAVSGLMGNQGYQPHDMPVLDPQGNDGGETGYGYYTDRDIDHSRTSGNRWTGYTYRNRDGEEIDNEGNRLVSGWDGMATVEAGSFAERFFLDSNTNPETGEKTDGFWTDVAQAGDASTKWTRDNIGGMLGFNNDTGQWDGGKWEEWRVAARGALEDVAGGIKEWLGDTWASFTTSLSEGFTNFRQGFQDLITAAAEWWTETRDGFYAWVADTWDSFLESIRSGISDIRDWFSGLGATIGQWFSDRGTDITDFVTNTWDWFTGSITSGLDNLGTWFTDTGQKIQDAFSGLPGFFSGIVDQIGNIWAGLKDAAAGPINWVIDNVINGALKSAWETVRKILPGLPEFPTVGNVGTDAGAASPSSRATGGAFATGGTFEGVLSGYTPGFDNQTIAVSGGETVMRPEWTMAVRGADPGYVERMNLAARRGGVNGVRNQMRMQRFAEGGTVANGAQMTTDIQRSMWDAVRTAFPAVTLTSATRPGDSGQHGQGRALDLVGPMQQIADWIFRTYPSSKHLIWGPGPFIADGNTDQEYARSFFRDDIEDHWDHVHWAMTQIVNSAGELVSSDAGSSGGGFMGGLMSRAIEAASKPLDDMIGKIPNFGDSAVGQIPREFAQTIKDQLVGVVRDTVGLGSDDPVVGDTSGADQWTDAIKAALEREGFEVNERNINLTKSQIMSESGGNANIAQQITDINGTGEEAGVGLLQVIPGTFQAFRNPALPNNRRDPDANISAALRYYKSKYGLDLGVRWGKGMGYKDGGIIPGWSPGWDEWLIGVSGGESVMRPEWTAAVGADYVNGMNSAARSGGVPAVQSAMDGIAGFAGGGVVDDWWKKLKIQQQNAPVLNAPLPQSNIPSVDPAVAAGNGPKGLNGEDLIAPDGTPYAAMGPSPALSGAAAPEDYIRQRLEQYGTEVWDITKAAVPEILGIQGTPLDPASNRWVQLAKQVDETFGITSGEAFKAAVPQATAMPDSAIANGAGEPGVRFGDINITVSSVDQAMREAKRYQNEQVAAFSGRFARR